jgi:hypothetical protein
MISAVNVHEVRFVRNYSARSLPPNIANSSCNTRRNCMRTRYSESSSLQSTRTSRRSTNLRVRQALNYAIDRAKMVQLYGGPTFAAPTCQPVAPGLPGYRRYCPYTQHPTADGRWSAPDLSRARAPNRGRWANGSRCEAHSSPAEGAHPRALVENRDRP